MKIILLLFSFMFIPTLVQSQTLTEPEITGTWQVVNVLETGSNPKEAHQMLAAYIDLNPDHSFQIRMRKDGKKEYSMMFSNGRWTFNTDNQTISINNGEMQIKPAERDGKMFFLLPRKGIKLEVLMPM